MRLTAFFTKGISSFKKAVTWEDYILKEERKEGETRGRKGKREAGRLGGRGGEKENIDGEDVGKKEAKAFFTVI